MASAKAPTAPHVVKIGSMPKIIPKPNLAVLRKFHGNVAEA